MNVETTLTIIVLYPNLSTKIKRQSVVKIVVTWPTK